jgi:putative sterol carrier protein
MKPSSGKDATVDVDDPTAEFLTALGRGEHQLQLGKASGTVRIELTNGTQVDSWFVVIREGQMSVSRKGSSPDCTVRTSKALFDGLVRGEVHALAALMQGRLAVEGNPELLVLLQRFFPSPPGTRGLRRGATTKARQR